MKKIFLSCAALLLCAVLYLALWPVPIDPVSWQAPRSNGLVDPFAPDAQLRFARGIPLGHFSSPEDAVPGDDGKLYVTTEEGGLLQIDNRGTIVEFAQLGGRPLGIVQDKDGSFLIANAALGLQRVSADGTVQLLLQDVDGQRLVCANNVTVASDGRVYFSECSSKFGVDKLSSYEASRLDLMEHGGHGRIIEFDPATNTARVIVADLNYANGVAIAADDSFLLIAETGHYRILKHWLSGPRAGSTEVILSNLPGFPDNISPGLQGRYWVGLAAPRVDILDRLSDKPWLRKVVQRLPSFVRPDAVPSSHVIAITADGQVLMNLQDPDARFPTLTGVAETKEALYLTTLFGNQLPRINKSDLLL